MPHEQLEQQTSAFFRGSISGVLVVALLQPFDVVKTNQQVRGCGPREALKSIIEQDGFKGLWLRGLVPTLARGALGPGTYFQALEFTEKWLKGKEQSRARDFALGAMARAIGAVVISPFSVLKARIEWDPRSGMRFNGFKDMFVGLGHTLARDVPFSGMYMVFYRFFKSIPSSSERRDHLGPGKSHAFRQFGIDLGAGLIAGVLATAITHPFDVYKTRAQVGLHVSLSEGIWSGLSLRLAKRPLSMALTWAFYEIVTSHDQVSVVSDERHR